MPRRRAGMPRAARCRKRTAPKGRAPRLVTALGPPPQRRPRSRRGWCRSAPGRSRGCRRGIRAAEGEWVPKTTRMRSRACEKMECSFVNMGPMIKLVLLRHGESAWNRENRFTGWTDVDLTEQGVEEARAAGRLLATSGFDFDFTYTSVLKRAIRTLHFALEEMDRLWLPGEMDWRLNERHYGALQGLNKAEMAAKFGEAQVLTWRRSYDVPPPELAPTDERYEGNDPRYAGVTVPRTECLKDTVARVLPYWNGTIAPAVRAGQRVLIAAHGNSLRALVKHLDGIGDAEIVGLNLPTGIPLVYELDEALRPRKHYYLGDAAEVARRVAAVSAQGKAKV